MDDITIEVSEFVNNISVTAQPNDQTIDITVTETVETVLLDVSTTVDEVTVTATQNVIVENITVDYVNNENNIDINVTDATQDVTLNITPTLVEINILRSGGEVNILQFNTLADFPSTGSSDYFYLAKDTNKLYRWTGSAYAEISATANAVWGQIIGTLSEQTDLQNALNLKAPINSPTFTGTVSGITKAMVGLAQVDNTSDLDKPISMATQTVLNNKQPLDGDLTSIAALSGTFGLLKKTANNSYTIDTNTYLTEITSSDVTDALGFTPENAANKGIANGYASLNGDGKVPSSQLPSYVDDVIEVANYGSLPSTGETGKIYITLDTNKIYRWSGSVYVEVSSSDAVWGAITGTLSNQTDLQNALNAKQDDLNGTGFVKASGTTISYDNTVYYPDSNPDGYTSNTGTVTSVAMTVPSAFSVSGSPITSSGTLAVTATGNTTQYIAGDGSLVTFPTMSTAGTLIREVRNTTGATLTKGTVVYISGATGNKPTVSKAIATGDSTSAQTFGLVQADIANNANGNVVCAGDITGIDTSALTEGAQLYLSSTTAGTYTTTKQYAPNHLVYIGIVTRAHPSLGQIEVNIQNGYELDELHNVAAQTPSNNDGLFYETSTSLWKNKSIANVLGYTPANGADYMSLSGDQTIAGLKTFSGFALFDHNIFIKQGTDTSFLSGYNVIDATSSSIFLGLPNTFGANLVLSGLSGQRNFTFPDVAGTFALTSDLHNAVTIGTANGLSLSTQVLSLALASTSATGALSSTDWNTFNGKQNALTNPVTGTGTTSYLPKFTGTSAIGNSLLYDTGSVLLVGATSASDGQSKLELVSVGTVGLKIISSGANGNNTFLSIQSSKEWRFLTNRGDLIGGNQGDLIIRNNTDGINHIILNQGGSTTFAGSVTATNYVASGGNNTTVFNSAAASTGWVQMAMNNTSGSSLFGVEGSTAGTLATGTLAYSSVLRNYTNTSFHIATNNTVRFTISGAGAATFSSSVSASFLTTKSGTGAAALLMQDTSGVNKWEIGHQSNNLYFYSYTSGSNPLYILGNGNVGIGTTAPAAKLDVRTGVAGTLVNFTDGVAQTFQVNTTSTGIDITNPNSGYISFSNTAERMRITSGGNVGIGTTTPTSPVANRTAMVIRGGSNGAELNLQSTSATDGTSVGFALVAASSDAYYVNRLDGAHIWLSGGGGNTERMRITSGGNVGIGTTSPGVSLEVNGLIRSVPTYNNTTATLPNLVVSAGGTFERSTTSSKRHKENITLWNGGGLNTILALQPKEFTYKSDYYNYPDRKFLGLIAEEVAEISSYLADFSNEDGTGQVENVRYANIVVPLIKAVQEQQVQIQELKQQLANK